MVDDRLINWVNMQTKPKSLTTAADDLLDIVKSEKEISFSDVAKKLNVSVQTIEAWATFLEEDGILAVKYKMTTPYLTLPSPAISAKQKKSVDTLFQDKLANAEIKTEIENTSTLLGTAEEKRAEGEFGVLEGIYGQAMPKLKKIMQFISSLLYLTPQEKARLIDRFSEAERKSRDASKLMKSNKFDEANKAYSALNSELKGIIEAAKGDYSETEELGVSRETGVKKLLDKTYSLLESGKLEDAVSNYEKTKKIFAGFSTQWMSEKSSMQDSILKLNRDIVIYSNRIMRQRMNEGVARISSLISSSRENLQKRKFAIATAYYDEIRKVFEKLPAGFAKEKRKLKEDILKIFEQIIREREQRLQYRFSLMSKEIDGLIREVGKHLEAGEADDAFKAYKRLSKTYSELPNGFLKEKLELQGRIMLLYSQLSQRLEKRAESELSAETNQILGLLGTMKKQMDSGRFEEAESTYLEINRIFERMPKGFVQQKTSLQEKIVSLYEQLLENMDATKSQAFRNSVEALNKLIKACQDSVKSGNYAEANALYKTLKDAYAKLPPLDIFLRQRIRNSILSLYRSIMLGEQQPAQSMAAQASERSEDMSEIAFGARSVASAKSKPAISEHAQEHAQGFSPVVLDIRQKIELLKSRSKAQVRMPAQ